MCESPFFSMHVTREKNLFSECLRRYGTLTGVSNEFQVNIRHPRATIYNDVSVNESFHAATAFRIAEVRGYQCLAFPYKLLLQVQDPSKGVVRLKSRVTYGESFPASILLTYIICGRQ